MSKDQKVKDPSAVSQMPRAFYLAVGATALLLMFYEIVAFQTLQFVREYLDAMLIIAIALLGISIGGLGAYVFRSRMKLAVYSWVALAFPLMICVSFGVLFLFPDKIWVFSVAMMLPFAVTSFILSSALSLAPANKVYAADLVGAAAGALVACVSVPLFREEGSILLIIAGGFGLVALFGWIHRKNVFNALTVTAIVLGILTWTTMGINMRLDFFNLVWAVQPSAESGKIFTRYAKKVKSGKVSQEGKIKGNTFRYMNSYGSLVERIDTVRTKTWKINTFFNGKANDHISTKPLKNFRRDRRITPGLIQDPSALIIGTAAEGATKLVKSMTNGRVVGVEINPAIIRAMKKPFIRRFSKDAYKGIDVHVTDARSYLARSNEKFDMITMLNTHRMRNIGYVGRPEYLHTVEAMKALFDHITDDGWLVLEERDVNKYARLGIIRFIRTASEVLVNQFGAVKPADHFWIYSWYSGNRKSRRGIYTGIMIRKTPIDSDNIAVIKSWVELQHKRFPDVNPNISFIVNNLPGDTTNHLYEKILLTDDPYSVMGESSINLEPIVDDKPFPFDVDLERPHLLRMIRIVGILTLILGLIPVALLLFIHSIRNRAGNKKPLQSLAIGLPAILYFALLGIGYLVIEVVFIQQLQVFLGMPVLVMAVVIAGMLFFSGLGSLFSANWSTRTAGTAFVIIIALSALTYSLLPAIIQTCIIFPLPVRIVITLLLMAPIGFAMGVPFPLGIRMIKEELHEGFAAAMFGLNGAFSALATPLALASATIVGFRSTFFLGVGAYGLSLLMLILMATFRRPSEE
jgi:hypothetical protein